MHTFNNFVFGHDLSKDEELNNDVAGFDLYFPKNINGKDFEVDVPYHGGQVAGDLQSVILGTVITDDDDNPGFIDEVRGAKEKDYINDYNTFAGLLIQDLQNNKVNPKYDFEGYNQFVDDLENFLKNNKPEFYSVEASS